MDEYASRIRESITLVQTGDNCIPAEQASILRQRFPRTLTITRKGQNLEVDCDPIGRWIDEAEKSNEGRTRLLAHMNALLGEIGDATGLPVSEQGLKAALKAVFGSREFRHLQKTEDPAWKAWLRERLRRIMEWLNKRFGGMVGRSLAWASLAVLGAIVLSGVVLTLWVIRSTGRTGWRWRQPAIARSEEIPENVPADWNLLRLEAEKKADAGELRDAVRMLFLSVLLEGHARGWWVYRPEATNTEHLLQMGRSQRRHAFAKLAELYEDAWYGFKSVRPGDFAAFKACAEQMGGA